MPNMIDLYNPRTLAEVVRTTPPAYTFLRDTFFSNVKTFTTKEVDIDIVKGGRKMAAFVHPLVGGEIIYDEGYETKSYTPPLVNPSSITTADQFLTRMPGEDLYSGMNPQERAARKLIEEYTKLDDAITRREEWMAAKVLTTGKLEVKGKGVNSVIDFGFTNKKTLTGTACWGKSAADPLKDMRDMKELASVTGFANCDTVIMGKAAAAAFMEDAKVQKMMDNRRFEMGGISPLEMRGGMTYYGRLSLPGVEIYGYNEVYQDDWSDPKTPKLMPLIPDNMVLMLPRSINFMRAYGLCTYLDDDKQWHTAETARLLRSYVEHRPDRRFVEAQSHPLLIPDKIDSWVVYTVM